MGYCGPSLLRFQWQLLGIIEQWMFPLILFSPTVCLGRGPSAKEVVCMIRLSKGTRCWHRSDPEVSGRAPTAFMGNRDRLSVIAAENQSQNLLALSNGAVDACCVNEQEGF